MHVDIILRTCVQRENNPDMRRITYPTPRSDLIRRCLNSIITSINYTNHEVTLHVIDGSEFEFSFEIERILTLCRQEIDFVRVDPEMNNNENMLFCYEFARDKIDDEHVIYFLEDDYLHFPNCIQEMADSYELFKGNLGGREVAIHPADSPLEYRPESIYPCRIVLGLNRHWRTTVSSSFAIMLSKKAFIENYKTFELYSRFDGETIHEANTINLLFIDKIFLFSPIPTLAFHIGYIYPPAPHIAYEPLWENSKSIY
jgi:hypothetical protein